MISEQSIALYRQQGFLILPGAISAGQIAELSDCVDALTKTHHPGHVLEQHGVEYRALHGCHLYDSTFRELIRRPTFLQVAKKLLQDEVYLHQLKVNLKQPFCGESWPWHQDYIYWRNEDLIPGDNIISAMIYLDEVNDFNGPLFFIPKSHLRGCIEPKANDNPQAGWEGNVSADLTYQVDQKTVRELAQQHGMVSTKGPRGTVVWFHGNLVHASPENISPYPRRVAILTYNAVSNKPIRYREEPRPEFLFGRDMQPLEEV